MKAVHIELALASALIMFLQAEVLLSQDQLVEVGIEMPGYLIRQGVFHGKVQFTFKGDSSEELILTSLKISCQNAVLHEKGISRKLVGVGNEWEEYQKTLDEYETLLSSRGEKEDIYLTHERLVSLMGIILQGTDIQTVTIDSSQLFGDSPMVGTAETMYILLEYEYQGETHTVEKVHSIQVLQPYPTIPNPEYPPFIDSYWHFGDLHVHTGYSSRAGYDGISEVPYQCDNCTSEAENPSGYTIAQFRDNAWSYGRDWMTITDHSYCIDLSTNECFPSLQKSVTPAIVLSKLFSGSGGPAFHL
ncbi:MAG: hypothetical protein HXS52_00785 [Theionarchaea archaeon]|nr:hypothetical protein [Theionarchaea archaeon]